VDAMSVLDHLVIEGCYLFELLDTGETMQLPPCSLWINCFISRFLDRTLYTRLCMAGRLVEDQLSVIRIVPEFTPIRYSNMRLGSEGISHTSINYGSTTKNIPRASLILVGIVVDVRRYYNLLL
jgi:hypothetical protein